jgi:UrcA family protein
MRSGRTLSALAIATALGLAATSGAGAQAVSGVTVHGSVAGHGTEVKNEPIKYADLDLSKPEGAEAMIGRFRAAATRVCKPKPTKGANFKDWDDYENCLDHAVKGAVADLNHPNVQKVFDRIGD